MNKAANQSRNRHNERSNENNRQIRVIQLREDRTSVLIEIFGQKYRALVDSGAEISIINKKVTENFPDIELLRSTEITLRTATGNAITVVGEVDLTFRLGKKYIKHTFIVAENVTQNVILGRDCLKANGMKIDFGNSQLQMKNFGVPLESDAYLDSLVRMANQKILKPQSTTLVWGKFRGQRHVPSRKLYSVSAINTGFTNLEPGLMVTNTVTRVVKRRKFPFLVCNNTDKTIKLNRGNVVARVEEVSGDCVPITEVPVGCSLTDDDDKEAVSIDSIPEEYREELEKLLRDNEDLFAASDMDLGRTDAVKMKIDTGDHPPIRMKPYRTPLNQREVVEKAVDDMLQADIIRPSKSSWSFPILLVPKKDGGRRFCVDFRRLNAITKNYVWPLPHIDDTLASLGKAQVFSSIDLKSGYWQVPMNSVDREKVAFTCHKGLYEFNSMPFGLSNAPSVFQELMTQVLEGINGQFAIAYLDDIIVYSPSIKVHLQNLAEVFSRLRKFGLKMKLSKCKFMEREIKYLGFKVGAEGIKVDQDKVEVIRKMTPPVDVRGVRGFIGCVSYYRRFCPRFSEIATPLIKLTKKHAKFEWTAECQTAFDKLKDLLSEAPTLAFPDPGKEYTLYTDSSGECIGAVLTQDSGQGEQPIHYLSHKLSDTQKKWPIVEKEAYAIYYALQKLDHYLHGAEFTIKCDHKPLKYLLSSEMKNRKIQMWAIAISSYNCQIEYIKGKDNEQADMLSRLSHTEKVDETAPLNVGVINSNRIAAALNLGVDGTGKEEPRVDKMNLPDMAKEQRLDVELRKLRKTLENPMTAESVKRKYAVVDDTLYYLGREEDESPHMRLMVPQGYKADVLKQYHDECSHWGIEKTFSLIKHHYHWVGLYKDVLDYVSNCMTCKVRTMRKNTTPLQEMDQVQYPGQKWGLDLCGPYPESATGARYILTAVDLYSGWPEIWALPDKKTEGIVRLVLDELIPRFSCPEKIVTDNGQEFKGELFTDMCRELNIKHIFTSPYHPQGNSQTERFHRVLNDMLSKRTARHPEMWDTYLPAILASYRVGISESRGYSPFYLMFTRDPVLPLDNLLKPRRRYLGEDYHKIALERQHEAFMNVRKSVRKARQRQKKYHDRRATNVQYQIGDPVYVENTNKYGKLEDKWMTHYRIMEQTGPVSFVVRNQLTGDVRRVHAEHLKLADLQDWPMPIPRTKVRKARYVVDPEITDSDDTEAYMTAEESSPEDEDNIPLARLKRKWTQNQT